MTLDDERPVADAVAGHDRQVRAQVVVAAEPSRVRDVLGDLGRLPAWMEMHGGWRGTPPTTAVEGLAFVEQVKIMGIPAEVAWTVTLATDDELTIAGEGPMGIE